MKGKGSASHETGSCADAFWGRSDVREAELLEFLVPGLCVLYIPAQLSLSSLVCPCSQHGSCAAPVLPCCQVLLPVKI